MTGSYRTECDDCDANISASARFCPSCGARQPWFDDDGVRHDPGTAVRDAYQTMFDRARAVDQDPADNSPRSFDHALRMVIPTAHVDAIEEVTDTDD